jgi:hypothetical protein
MKHRLSFVSVVHPYDQSEEASKLVKKNAIECRANVNLLRPSKKKPSTIGFHLHRKLLGFSPRIEGRRTAAGEKDSEHLSRRAATHEHCRDPQATPQHTRPSCQEQAKTKPTTTAELIHPYPLSQNDASIEGTTPERHRYPNRSFGFSP